MDILTNRYFSITRFFLVLMGQWPFQHTKVKQLKRAITSICLASFILVQIILSKGDTELLLGSSPFITFYVFSGVKYYTCWIQRGNIKDIFQHIERDMLAMMSKKEGKILRMYVNEGYMYGKFYTYLAITLLCGFTGILCTPSVLDFCLPLNETRREQLLFNFEYFADHPKYHYSFILYAQLCFIVGAFAVVAADLTYITILFHACGMFSAIGYKVEHLFDDIHEINNTTSRSITCKRIAEAVKLHCRTDKLIDSITSCYAVSYALQWVGVILSISSILLNVYRELSSNNMPLVIIFSGDLIVHYFLLFLNVLPAQKMLDCSVHLFYDTFNGLWYETSLETQKLLSFMMLKAMRPAVLEFPGIMKGTLETYSKMVQLSFSCFMVIRTLRQ